MRWWLLEIPVGLMLAYYACSNLSYAILTIVSLRANARHKFMRATVGLPTLRRSRLLPFVSIIVPARNEQLSILDSVRSLLDLDYPELEVIVVNDGSTDETLSRLRAAFHLREARLLYIPEIVTAKVNGIYLSASQNRLISMGRDRARGGGSQ